MATNIQIITGNCVADPELKITDSGMATCKFRIAQTERKKDDMGNWIDGDTLYMSCTAFGATAEAIAQTVFKGTPLVVTGRLKSRTVEKDGVKNTYFSINVDTCGVDVKQSLRKSEPADPWATSNSPF